MCSWSANWWWISRDEFRGTQPSIHQQGPSRVSYGPSNLHSHWAESNTRPSDHPSTQLPWLPKMTWLCLPHGSRKPGSSMKIWRWHVVKGICNDAEGRSWPHGRASSSAAGDAAQLPTAPTHTSTRSSWEEQDFLLGFPRNVQPPWLWQKPPTGELYLCLTHVSYWHMTI